MQALLSQFIVFSPLVSFQVASVSKALVTLIILVRFHIGVNFSDMPPQVTLITYNFGTNIARMSLFS